MTFGRNRLIKVKNWCKSFVSSTFLNSWEEFTIWRLLFIPWLPVQKMSIFSYVRNLPSTSYVPFHSIYAVPPGGLPWTKRANRKWTTPTHRQKKTIESCKAFRHVETIFVQVPCRPAISCTGFIYFPPTNSKPARYRFLFWTNKVSTCRKALLVNTNDNFIRPLRRKHIIIITILCTYHLTFCLWSQLSILSDHWPPIIALNK